MKKPVEIIRMTAAAALALLLLLTACGEASPSPAPGIPVTPGTLPAASTERQSLPSPEASSAGTSESTAAESASESRGPVTTELTLATLNIKHGAEGLEKIAEAIRDVSPDIIGLQEVDVHSERSGLVDEPAELARLAEYPYYAFSKAIPLGSGEYGTAVLSRFPIESFEVFPMDSGRGEDRSLGHAVIYVEGVKLDVFVTHLSFEDRNVRISQMKFIAGKLKTCSRYALLGDLNSFNIEDISYLEAAYYLNTADRHYGTFRRIGSSPDNIVLSNGFTELFSGVSDAEVSDHKLLYGIYQFSGE